MSRPVISGHIALSVFVCLLLVVGSSVPLVTATVGTTPEITVEEQENLATSVFFQQNNTNSTVVHKNPEKVEGNGDLSSVQSWLAGRMSETLIDCTNGLLGELDGACKQLDKKYPEWLGDYVNVTREIESQNGAQGNDSQRDETNTSAVFKRAKENQQQYVATVTKFNETYAEYQQARENGNTQKARAKARKLLHLAQRANDVGANLTENYRSLGNFSSTNVTTAVVNINNTTTHVTTVAETISTERFINTTLTVTASRERISFLRPLHVSGRLTTEDGTPLADKTIVLQAGNYTHTTTTDADGEFSITYRPALVTLDTQNVTVRYVPKQLSPYLSSNATVPVNITQVTPTVTLTVQPDTASFNDLISVSGRVTVSDTGVSSIPVVVSIDGQQLNGLSRVTTIDSGVYKTAGRLPADVATGKQTVTVTIPLEGRAIAGVTATEPITITPTPTKLSLAAPSKYSLNESTKEDTEIAVSGRLTTESGTPIANRMVELRVQGETVGTVRTNQNGRYAANISVPPALLDGQSGTVSMTVVAIYRGADTSFESSRATTQIRIVLPETGFVERISQLLGSLSTPLQLLLGLGVLLIAILIGYAVRRRRGAADSDKPTNGIEPSGSVGETVEEPSLIAIARKRLAAGDAEQAIVTGYAAVRERLSETFGIAATQTHWEFLQAYQSRVADGTRLDFLRRLTEAYERAVFAPQTPSEETATEAVENAQQLEENTAYTDDPDEDR